MATVPASHVEESEAPADRYSGLIARQRVIAYAVLLIAIAFSAVSLLPEGTIHAPQLNDNVLHQLMAKETAAAWSAGKNPTDPWLAQIGFGYPLAHHYQHLEYIPVAALHLLFQRAFSINAIIAWSTVLLLTLFPLSIYFAMRQFGFDYLAAAFGGMAAPLIATNGLYGFDFGSYVWRGYGLYTQLWGMFLMPLALAAGYKVLRHGKGYFVATLLLVVTMLCHTVYGYMTVVSLGIIALVVAFEHGRNVDWRTLWRSLRRLLLLIALTGLAGSYFFVPFLVDRAYMNRSVWELSTKYNSYGAHWVLRSLGTGKLFDFGRVPILTLLVGIGLVVCVARWREPRYRMPVILFGAWLALYFGRPTWGPLFDLLPLSSSLQLHRFIGGVHLGGLLLIGVALAAPWTWLMRRKSALPTVGAALLCAILLYPAFHERSTFLSGNATLMQQSRDAYAAEQPQLNALFDTLHKLPPGRVYAGLAGTWGNTYRVGSVPMYALLQDQGFDMLGYLYHALSLNSDIEVLFNDQNQAEYNLFNVRYVVAPAGRHFPSFVKPIGTFGNNRLYQVDTTGYFDLVQPTVTLVGGKSDFYQAASSWLRGAEPALKQEPILELGGSPASGATTVPLAIAAPAVSRSTSDTSAPEGTILSEQVGNNGFYATTVNVKAASMVMAKVTDHPGWHVTVDGTTVKPVMLMPSFVGIPVPAGTHRIELTYQASSLRTVLEVLGLLTLILIALAEWRRADIERWLQELSSRSPLVSLLVGGASRPGRERSVDNPVSGPLPSSASEAGASTGSMLRSISSAAVSGSETDVQFPLDQAPVVNHDDELSRRSNFRVSPSIMPFVSTRTKIGIYLLFFAVYLFTGSGHFYSTDHVAVYLTTQSMVEHHSLAIKPIARAVQGRNGSFYGRYGLLQSVVSIPLYVLGVAVDHLASASVRSFLAGPNIGDWGGTVPIFFVSLLNAFVMPLTCLLIFLFSLRLGFTRRVAYPVMFLFGFATLAWTYADTYFQHPLEMLFLLLSIYILFVHRDRPTLRSSFMAGIPLGLAMLTRLNIALVVPSFAVYVFFISSKWDGKPVAGERLANNPIRRFLDRIERPFSGIPVVDWWSITTVRCVVGFLAVPTLALITYLALNYYRFDTIRDPAVNNIVRGSLDIFIGLYGNLLSPGRSIFLYSPPLILGLVAFHHFYRRHRAEALLVIGISLTYLVLYSIPVDWDGGWSWGPRYLLAVVPLLILPLGYFLTSPGRFKIAALAGVIGVGIQLLGVTINVSYVHWDWINMHLNPTNAYLFTPQISAIPTHLTDLLHGKHVDVWVIWVGQNFGVGAAFGLIIVAVAVVVTGAVMILEGESQQETTVPISEVVEG